MKFDSDLRLVRLLQLVSPTLPVGAYSYSQGLESAVDAGVVRAVADAESWIGDMLEYAVVRMEAPLLLRLIDYWSARSYTDVVRWNDLFLASRETAELRAETIQMGYSLKRLLMEMEGRDEETRAPLTRMEEMAFPTAFAFAAARWQIPAQPALVAYLWAWLENQVMAAIKIVPLGQTDGQRILLKIGERLPAIAELAATIHDDDLGTFAPHLAILSSRHETQYSRLFRS
ncbi:MAG TPA: urease accessory UreF family protein [Terriglobales bacterium]|jgi:urease accessory protein|nr:urease accessory UreF family protein [Terriglobales bacterium]